MNSNKLNKIKLVKDLSYLYKVMPTSDIPLDILAEFLTFDVRRGIAFGDWLYKDELEDSFIGGEIYCMRREGTKIRIDTHYDDYKSAFETDLERMKDLLKDWYYLLNLDPTPDEIIITRAGKEIFFEPIFYKNSDVKCTREKIS